MPFRIKVSLFVLAFLAVLVFVVPLLVPVPPAPKAPEFAATNVPALTVVAPE